MRVVHNLSALGNVNMSKSTSHRIVRWLLYGHCAGLALVIGTCRYGICFSVWFMMVWMGCWASWASWTGKGDPIVSLWRRRYWLEWHEQCLSSRALNGFQALMDGRRGLTGIFNWLTAGCRCQFWLELCRGGVHNEEPGLSAVVNVESNAARTPSPGVVGRETTRKSIVGHKM